MREAGSLWTRLGKKGSPQALWNRQMEMQGKRCFIPDLLWRFGGTGKLSRSMIFVSAQAVETNEVEKWRIQEENKSLVPTSGKKKGTKVGRKCLLAFIIGKDKEYVWPFLLGNWPLTSAQKKWLRNNTELATLQLLLLSCPLLYPLDEVFTNFLVPLLGKKCGGN